jgi:hypothetical protein
MSHFAKVENGIVTNVIVAEEDIIASGLHGEPSTWVQTSYNTRMGVHWGTDADGNNLPDGGIALRGNYAGIGFIYDSVNDVFYPPQPFTSWVLNNTNWSWEPPVPRPEDASEEKIYNWDEATVSWVLQS